jgi:DNA invertase Pin-like site-specific DNA recombinase
MNVAIYARVSTDGQDPELQLSALRAHTVNRGWTIVGEYVDRGFSGAKEKRPALDQMLRIAWDGQIKAVAVWRFDRFARSVKHLLKALEDFRSLHINFISLQEQFDTSTPIGQAMFTIIGAMAQLERDIIRERVKAGLFAARARGQRLGRPAVRLNIDEVDALRSHGHSLREIARQFRCSRSTVRRRLREEAIGTEREA